MRTQGTHICQRAGDRAFQWRHVGAGGRHGRAGVHRESEALVVPNHCSYVPHRMRWRWRIPVLMPCVLSGVAPAKVSGITSGLRPLANCYALLVGLTFR
jgi:hypothetical protein